MANVHNLGAVAAWASSVAMARGTALATALIVGLQPFIAGLAESPQPTPPLAAGAPTATSSR